MTLKTEPPTTAGDGSASDQPITIRPPLAGLLGSLFATFLLAVVTLFMLGFSILLIGSEESGLGLFIMAVGVVMGILSCYCLRDCRGKLGWRITVGTQELNLRLPAGRSLVHRLARMRARVPFRDIEAVETRYNAYSQLGTCHIHHCYALKLKTGELIVLGEDRALSTGLATSLMAAAVDAICSRTDLPIRNLGMAKGRSGALSVLFAAPPPWNAPSLSDTEQADLWQAAAETGQLAQYLAFLPLVTAQIVVPQDRNPP